MDRYCRGSEFSLTKACLEWLNMIFVCDVQGSDEHCGCEGELRPPGCQQREEPPGLGPWYVFCSRIKAWRGCVIWKQTLTNFTVPSDLGQKFPKSREVTMEGGIRFAGQMPGPVDPLCTDLTAYIKVRITSLFSFIYIYLLIWYICFWLPSFLP